MTGPVSGGIAALLQTGRFAGESVHFGKGRGAWKGGARGWRGRDRPALMQEGRGAVVRGGWRRVREGREGNEEAGLVAGARGCVGGGVGRVVTVAIAEIVGRRNEAREQPQLGSPVVGTAVRGLRQEPGGHFGAHAFIEAVGVVFALHPLPCGVPDGIVLVLFHS